MQNQTSLITQENDSSKFLVAPGISGMRIVFVNVFMVSEAIVTRKPSWVLIDAGLKGSAKRIKKAAEEWFGKGTKPSAILLTHGHFDHIGALPELLKEWNVPVYAHPLEMPYLTGRSSYPPPDPVVGGGGMAYLSWVYPNSPIDLSDRIKPLPADGTVPGLPGWRWIFTPGHAPGHVSFFRENDRALIAGDAFVTTNQESVLSVITQKEEIHRPPAYFTMNWQAARRSVEHLSILNPYIVATGHGKPMYGEAMRSQLRNLANNFFEVAVPTYGRYVRQPAHTDERGIIDLPPPILKPTPSLIVGFGLAFAASVLLLSMLNRQKIGHEE